MRHSWCHNLLIPLSIEGKLNVRWIPRRVFCTLTPTANTRIWKEKAENCPKLLISSIFRTSWVWTTPDRIRIPIKKIQDFPLIYEYAPVNSYLCLYWHYLCAFCIAAISSAYIGSSTNLISCDCELKANRPSDRGVLRLIEYIDNIPSDN